MQQGEIPSSGMGAAVAARSIPSSLSIPEGSITSGAQLAAPPAPDRQEKGLAGIPSREGEQLTLEVSHTPRL